MCFHLGYTEAFIWDRGTDKERITGQEETAEIKREITEEITKNNKELVYAHPVCTFVAVLIKKK